MRTEVITTNQGELAKPYPKLMKSIRGEAILFFYGDKKGVVVNKNERHEIGEHSEHWDMNCFIDLPSNQQVILQND